MSRCTLSGSGSELVQEIRPFVSDWGVKAKQFSLNELLPNSETLTLRSAVRTEAGWVVEAVGADDGHRAARQPIFPPVQFNRVHCKLDRLSSG